MDSFAGVLEQIRLAASFFPLGRNCCPYSFTNRKLLLSFSPNRLAMKIKHAALLLIAPLVLNSCKLFHKGDDYDTGDTLDSSVYDTANPYGVPGNDTDSLSSHAINPPASSNPTYSAAAYEDHSAPVKSAKVKATVTEDKVVKATTKAKTTTTAAKAKATTATVAAAKTTTTSKKTAAAAKTIKPTKGTTAKQQVHTVTSGDSLWTLSRKYHVSADAIKKANGLKKDVIITGSKLIIPAH
jgi:LysM repeat protein